MSGRCCALSIVTNVSPLEKTDFEWPSLEETRAIQEKTLVGQAATNYTKDAVNLVWVDTQERTWIPDHAVDLPQRLCVIAHAGVAGHCGIGTTYEILAANVVWKTMRDDVHKFVSKCLHCLVVQCERCPRPYGKTLRAIKPMRLYILTTYRCQKAWMVCVMSLC